MVLRGNMVEKNNDRLLIDIAKMYYDEAATQEDIAQQFNISRSLVSKHLSLAREKGLVEIVVHDESIQPFKVIEDRIMKKYDLEDVICVSSADTSQIKFRVGLAAAKYLSKIVAPDMFIGCSAGTTVHEVAEAMNLNLNMSNLTFVPMVGGLGMAHTDIQANVICDIFARKTGGNAIQLHAPLVVDDENSREVFVRQRFIKEILDLARHVDVAVVGIGGQPAYYEMTKAYLHKIEPLDPKEAEYVTGDILYNFFDQDGRAANSAWNKRVINLSIEDLMMIPKVIGVAYGPTKIDAIHAALNGELIYVLITDVNTAKQLLDK